MFYNTDASQQRSKKIAIKNKHYAYTHAHSHKITCLQELIYKISVKFTNCIQIKKCCSISDHVCSLFLTEYYIYIQIKPSLLAIHNMGKPEMASLFGWTGLQK